MESLPEIIVHEPRSVGAEPAGRSAACLESTSRSAGARALAGLLVLAAIAFSPALLGPFLLDDRLLVLENPHFHSPGGVGRLFLEPVVARLPGGAPNVYYRPLSFLTLWLDLQLWGARPFGFHLTALLLHLGSAFLLFRIARRWLAEREGDANRAGIAAAAVAGLWALFPVQAEAVGYIAARNDVLFCFLYFLALDLYSGGVGRLRGFLYAALAVAAFLSKEMAVTLPAAAILHDWILSSDRSWRSWRRAAGNVALLSGLLGLHALVVSRVAAGGSLPAAPEVALDLGRVGAIAGRNLEILLSPLAYSIDRSQDPLGGILALSIAAAALAALVAVLLWLARGAPPAQRRLALFGLLLAGVSYAPVSGVVPLYTTCADRYLYLPAAGLALAVVSLLAPHSPGWFAGRRAVWPAVRIGWGVIVLSLAGLTLARATLFADEERLYAASLRASPGSPLLHNNLGLLLRGRGDRVGAAREYREALTLRPDYQEARFNLGVNSRELGDAGAAEGLLADYVRARGDDPDGWIQWGAAAFARGDRALASERWREALRHLPPGDGRRAAVERLIGNN